MSTVVRRPDGTELPPSPLLDWDQAAAYLNTTPRHVKQLWYDHQLPGVRLGKKVRFVKAHLDEWVASQSVGARRS